MKALTDRIPAFLFALTVMFMVVVVVTLVRGIVWFIKLMIWGV